MNSQVRLVATFLGPVQAYWTSLLTAAIHTTGYLNDYPTVLIIDTPQLALTVTPR